MFIENDVSLQPFNTFGIDVRAEQLVRISSPDNLREIITSSQINAKPRLILGGGSNILFTEDFPGVVLKNEIFGREVIKENDDHVWVKIGAGENWHEIVMWVIENQWAGIENLSLIPGTVGAAPMQNIGAYGVELAEVFEYLEAVNMQTGEVQTFQGNQCQFGYRYSIFKGALRGKHLISNVVLRLNKKPKFNISYGAVEQTLKDMGVDQLSLKAISDAVIAIRQSKLPDPAVLGNAGSFFKNPTIEEKEFAALKSNYPDLPGYNLPQGKVKVPAGWLIEQCQWKGKRRGAVGVHKNQALVLINYGGGQGHAIHKLALDIQASVLQTFNIQLDPEVNIIKA